ncbi:MAG TPA: peptidylprolyl isomerase [Spirochaetota bacterium]|nr:peptidylprolyl isomerase [Spirochaetota bacterium]HPJ35592.1 peptidylprolyl isomerase [Spirochaetota bacterium]
MLKVENNKVVTFEYTLKNDNGDILDTSANHSPLVYIHGSGNIIPGLESELEGKQIGDKFQASIDPENAYGIRYDELVQKIERDKLAHLDTIEIGMQLQAYDEQGMQILTVVDVSESEVTLDGNHPLAGETLHFDVEVTGIRDTTEEEAMYGLNAGGGGCSGCSGCDSGSDCCGS